MAIEKDATHIYLIFVFGYFISRLEQYKNEPALNRFGLKIMMAIIGWENNKINQPISFSGITLGYTLITRLSFTTHSFFKLDTFNPPKLDNSVPLAKLNNRIAYSKLYTRH